MSGFHVDDDFFSPVRLDSSIIDGNEDSCGSLSDMSNSSPGLSFNTVAHQNAIILDDEAKFRSQREISTIDQQALNVESVNTITPSFSKRSSDLLNTKKLDKINDFKLKNMKENNHSKKNDILKKEYQHKVNELDSIAAKLATKQKDSKKRSQSSASLQSNESTENAKDKNSAYSLKNVPKADSMQAPIIKHPSDKKLIDNSLKKISNVLKFEDVSGKHSELNGRSSANDSVTENFNNQAVQNPEIATNVPVCQYEASVEKIVHDCVDLECAKIRQIIYQQQMSFYRQINEIKAQMETQHSAMTERLLKVIEELMRINATLKSTSC